MAVQSPAALDRTFRALSDGTRRSMIDVLARRKLHSASDLGRRFRSAQPTISKHLKVLEEAGLVVCTNTVARRANSPWLTTVTSVPSAGTQPFRRPLHIEAREAAVG